MKFRKKKLISFVLTFALALMLAGSGTAVGLSGILAPSMTAKAAPGDIYVNDTNFPDEIFRSWVREQTYGSDSVLTATEIASITSISVNFKNISNLKGIEYFTALTDLSCSYNKFTSLDLSHNTALQTLNCYGNQFTELDLSNNTALTSLDCSSCSALTSLDLSNNTALTSLKCGSCSALTSLDVSHNTALQTLDCYGNQFTELDVSHNTALTSLNCGSGRALTSLDLSNNTALTSLRCDYCSALTGIDVSNNTRLTELWCSDCSLTSLDVSNNTALKRLYCYGNQFTSLDLSHNTALEQLSCYQNNQLTSLDLSHNTALTSLSCYNCTALTSLDVSNSTALTSLWCSYTQLTSLDLSHSTALTSLKCYNCSALTSLDLSNNTALTELACYQCSRLTTLKVNFASGGGGIVTVFGSSMSNNNFPTVSITGKKITLSNPSLGYWKVTSGTATRTAYSGSTLFEIGTEDVTIELCANINSTNFPDEIFRNWVLSQDYGTDGVLTATEIVNITNIDVSNKNISNLTGIEYFTALTSLNCNGNNLSNLYLNYHKALTTLDCSENQLTSLYLSSNTALETLSCAGNPLTYLKYSLAASNGGTVEITNGGHGTFIPSWESNTISGKLTLAPDNYGVTDTHVFANWAAEGAGVDLSMSSDGQTATVTFNNSESWTDKSVKISGTWGERIYVLTVKEVYQDENGEVERTETTTENHSYNDSVTKTATVPEGYSIVGESSQTVTMDDNKEITFTYRKTPTEYTLTVNEVYQDENGAEERTVTDTETITAGETVTKTATAPTGYAIVGESSQTVTMDDNKTITFTYKKNTYDITYDLAGGELPSGVTNPSTYTVESDTFTLNDPSERTGYTFDGWIGSNGTTAQTTVTVAQGTTGNLNYTANWTLKSWYEDPDGDGIATLKPGYNEDGSLITYNITYDLDGGTATAINPTTYTVETDDITLSVATKAGSTFNGWTGSNGSIPQRSVTIPKGSTGDKSYTANWTLMGGYNPDGTPITYDITYDLAGGELPSGVTNPSTYTVESDAFTLNNPVDRIGYTFDGWTGSNGTTPQTAVTVTQGTTGNLNYAANWTLKSWYEDPDGDGVATLKAGYNPDGTPITYSITYDLAGGSLPAGETNPLSYNVESDTFTLVNPERDGHTFTGWTGSNGSTPQTTVTVSKGTLGEESYTANWELRAGYNSDGTLKDGYNSDGTTISYTIAYDFDGGNLPTGLTNPTIYNVESSAITLKNPERENYTFVGWTGSNGTVPQVSVVIPTGTTGNLSYAANWQVQDIHNDYTVNASSSIKMAWVGSGTESYTKQMGHVSMTTDIKKTGRLSGVAIFTVDASRLPTGRSITVSIPDKNINLTIGGVAVPATVDFTDTTLTSADGTRQLIATVTTGNLDWDDVAGKSMTGGISYKVVEN